MERYRDPMLKDAGRCLGSYAFIWQWRHERTHTWYGLFLESGERTESVSALQYLWSGRWPANRAPHVEPPRIDGKQAADNVYLKPGSPHAATHQGEDPEGDPLAFAWEVMPEVARAGYAGLGERRSRPHAGTDREGRRRQTRLPRAAGRRRLPHIRFRARRTGQRGHGKHPFFGQTLTEVIDLEKEFMSIVIEELT